MNPSVLLAYLSCQVGMTATCATFGDLSALEDEIFAGRPVIVAMSAALPSLSPHVVVGFTDHGDVLASDPARERGPKVIERHDFARRWLLGGEGRTWTFVPET